MKLDISATQENTTSEWTYKIEKEKVVENWWFISQNIIVLTASIYTLVRVLCISRRTEWLFIAFPTLLIICATGAIITYSNILYKFTETEWMLACFGILYSLPHTLAHWFFSFQYLQTSLTLPLYLKLVKIEQLMVKQPSSDLDCRRITTEVFDEWKHCDSIVSQRTKQIQRRKTCLMILNITMVILIIVSAVWHSPSRNWHEDLLVVSELVI